MSPKIATWIRKLKKYHKWPGILISLFVFLFAFSGILLNHRNFISSVEFSRKWMPPGYQYENWNMSSVRSSLIVGNDSSLLYGNIGTWLVTSGNSDFHDFNNGFPAGIDERKIYSIVKFRDHLVAGTHFGLYTNSFSKNKWEAIPLPPGEERISDLKVRGDTLMILTRNNLFLTADLVRLEKVDLPPPVGYEQKASLFLTLWNLHSGELFGTIGMLFVDLLGIVLIFLTLSGLMHFLFPKWITYRKAHKQSYSRPLYLKRWNLKWHNLIGYIFAVFLVINTLAGMFLRPPLLIPISSTQVGVVPHSHLDSDNPWFDKMRRIVWEEKSKGYIFYTSDGFFYTGQHFKDNLVSIPRQPLVSIMGCNVLEPFDNDFLLVGSFSGLFLWNPMTGVVLDYFKLTPVNAPSGIGRPVGQNMVAGYMNLGTGKNYWLDYNLGALPLNGAPPFPAMPAEILDKSPVSLWNAALEVHTGRIFEHLVGPLYLLYVPLVGLAVLVVLISGFIIWWLAYKKKSL